MRCKQFIVTGGLVLTAPVIAGAVSANSVQAAPASVTRHTQRGARVRCRFIDPCPARPGAASTGLLTASALKDAPRPCLTYRLTNRLASPTTTAFNHA